MEEAVMEDDVTEDAVMDDGFARLGTEAETGEGDAVGWPLSCGLPRGVELCAVCEGSGREIGADRDLLRSLCPACDGIGFFGIDPRRPTPGPRGSLLKTATLVVRHREGLPLFHPLDQG